MRHVFFQPLAESRLPPCGGSGLKYFTVLVELDNRAVSLHAEGVD